jgi:hypothetical protein
MKIHVSEHTKLLLNERLYDIVERGKIEVKGKGEMKTYFITGKVGEDGKPIICPFMQILEDHKKKFGESADDIVVPEDKHAGFQALDEPIPQEKPKPKPQVAKEKPKPEVKEKPKPEVKEAPPKPVEKPKPVVKEEPKSKNECIYFF